MGFFAVYYELRLAFDHVGLASFDFSSVGQLVFGGICYLD